MITLKRQAERATLEWQAAKNRLDEVTADKKWPLHDIEQKRVCLAELAALKATMDVIAAHAERVGPWLDKMGQGE